MNLGGRTIISGDVNGRRVWVGSDLKSATKWLSERTGRHAKGTTSTPPLTYINQYEDPVEFEYCTQRPNLLSESTAKRPREPRCKTRKAKH